VRAWRDPPEQDESQSSYDGNPPIQRSRKTL
jgi:hypothetical protein